MNGTRTLPPLALFLLIAAAGCTGEPHPFDPQDPAAGPGQLVGNGGPVSDGAFEGGGDALPQALSVEPPEDGAQPDCGADCQAFCQGLDLQNPVNRGLCGSLWGAGLDHRPIDVDEACRRLHVDMLGRFPTAAEIGEVCRRDGVGWGEIVAELMASDEFVLINQRRWADKLLYNNQAVSVERIFDADDLVGKLYRGQVAYDQFAAVVSAHPVLTRRFATPGDRAEFLFHLFLDRPPLGSERSDFGRLYTLWDNGYWDHPALGERLPDAFIGYRCVGEDGQVDPAGKGECTSVIFGYNELILTPDLRADGGQMWSGLLTADEWAQLQLPGRLIAQRPRFWETAADDVLTQYLGYDLGALVPEVRAELVRYVLSHNGDLRALHFAVATSAAYLQSARGETVTDHRWTFGPLKQVEVEPWIDSVGRMTGYDLSACDHRMPRPEDFLQDGTSLAGHALVKFSRWELTDEGEVATGYRNLARTLGGCPANESGGRFKTISILTTAAQLNFVNQVCNPGLEADGGRTLGAAVDRLLPAGMDPATAVTAEVAERVLDHQSRTFLGRAPTSDEVASAREAADACELCRAEELARPVCYATLSSSEMLFY